MPSAERAVEHIRYLAEHIGPRPTGSPPENEGFAYGEWVLQSLGLLPRRDPVHDIRPHVRFSWLFAGIITAFTAGVLLIEPAPWLLLAVVVVVRFVITPIRIRRAALPVRGGLNSFNVIADQPAMAESKAILILGAHLDTAVARVYSKTGLRALARKVFGFRGVIIVLLLLIVARVLDIMLPLFVNESTAEAYASFTLRFGQGYMVLIWIYVMLNALERLFKPMIYAPGANDNASGVGIVLALAEHYAAQPPKHLTLRYILFCAEEVGLVGSARYAQKLTVHEKNRLYMLNFDMVGTGEKVKHVRPRTSSLLNGWLREGGASKGGLIELGFSDYRSFAKHDIPVASLYNVGDKMVFQVYHSTEDVIDYINPVALEKTMQAACTLVQRLDEYITQGRK